MRFCTCTLSICTRFVSRKLTHHNEGSWSSCSKCHLDHVTMIPKPPPRLKLGYHHHFTMGCTWMPTEQSVCFGVPGFCLILCRLLSLALYSHNHAVSLPTATTACVHHRKPCDQGKGQTSVPGLGDLVGAGSCAESGRLSYCPLWATFCFQSPHSAVRPRASVFQNLL